MIAIDTNVLVRYVLPDNPAQAALASRLIDERCTPESPGFINLITLAEFCWVLHKGRKIPKHDLLLTMQSLIENRNIAFAESETVVSAMLAYADGDADFVDYLVYFHNRKLGAKTTMTFDKDAVRGPYMTLLE